MLRHFGINVQFTQQRVDLIERNTPFSGYITNLNLDIKVKVQDTKYLFYVYKIFQSALIRSYIKYLIETYCFQVTLSGIDFCYCILIILLLLICIVTVLMHKYNFV